MIKIKNLILSILLFQSFTLFGMDSSWKEIANEDKIKVYAKETQNSIIPFRAQGIIYSNIEVVLKTLKNYKIKHRWSPKLKSVKIHKDLGKEEYIFSEYYKTPWPAYDREFLLKGSIKQVSANKYRLVASSIDDKSLSDDGHVQANVELIHITIEKISEQQTQLDFEFHGDMKGWIPVWLMNIIQKKWPLRFIQALRKQVNPGRVKKLI